MTPIGLYLQIGYEKICEYWGKIHFKKSILNYRNVHSDDDIILRGFLSIRVIAILTKEWLIKGKK